MNGRAIWAAVRRYWPTVSITVGAFLLAYVGWQYLGMWREQRAFAEEWSRRAPSTTAPLVIHGNIGVAQISIPKLQLQATVLEGTSYKTLKLGPGHISGTALPGDLGNAALAGHRDTFFRKLDELTPGDAIDIERDGHKYEFSVSERKIVAPGDVSVLRNTPDATLTLVTCYPMHYIGPAPKRLVILARATKAPE